MSAKKTSRGTERTPTEVPSTSATTSRDHSPALSIKSEACDTIQDIFHLPDPDTDTDQETGKTQTQMAATRKRKSKKDIPPYKWSDEQTRVLAENIEMNPCLYDKGNKEWVNLSRKTQIWEQIGQKMEPVATVEQCKKWYDNQRTRLGKIIKKKSGQGRQVMSGREEEIVETWTFLKQHLQERAARTVSEKFGVDTSEAEDQESVVEDDDLSSLGEELIPNPRATSSTTGRPAKRLRTTSPVPPQTTSKADEFWDAFLSVSKELMPRQTPQYSGHRKLIHNFATLLESHMELVDPRRWHEYQIALLNLTEEFKLPEAVQQQQQQYMQQQASYHWPQ